MAIAVPLFAKSFCEWYRFYQNLMNKKDIAAIGFRVNVICFWQVLLVQALIIALGEAGTLQQGVKRRSEAYKRNTGTYFVNSKGIALQKIIKQTL